MSFLALLVVLIYSLTKVDEAFLIFFYTFSMFSQ